MSLSRRRSSARNAPSDEERGETAVFAGYGVIENPKTSVWYKKTPIGKNTINNIMMKAMKKNSSLKVTCPDKKLTNHSARKTVVKKLKSSGIPKCELKNITDHSSKQGLDDYDSGDERRRGLYTG